MFIWLICAETGRGNPAARQTTNKMNNAGLGGNDEGRIESEISV
jgi:hypothetical protein